MKISIISLFPQMFTGPMDTSILKRANVAGKLTIEYVNIRDFARDRYKSVDDHPYGGGIGMVLRVDVVDRAIQSALSSSGLTRGSVSSPKTSTDYRMHENDIRRKTILLDPQGTPYTQKKARELSKLDHLILVCGHYEGVDERIRDLVDEEISIGDYILTGGEIPAMALVDSIVLLIPGVLSKTEATHAESFEQNILEYPQYTTPRVYRGKRVPSVLLSGNHALIASWRMSQALVRTKKRRPDLLSRKRQ